MYKLKIITSTVRPGRKGPTVAQWISEVAQKQGSFEVELLDLAQINLPPDERSDSPDHEAV